MTTIIENVPPYITINIVLRELPWFFTTKTVAFTTHLFSQLFEPIVGLLTQKGGLTTVDDVL